MKPVGIQRRRTSGYGMQAASRAANGMPCISVCRLGRCGEAIFIPLSHQQDL